MVCFKTNLAFQTKKRLTFFSKKTFCQPCCIALQPFYLVYFSQYIISCSSAAANSSDDDELKCVTSQPAALTAGQYQHPLITDCQLLLTGLQYPDRVLQEGEVLK